MDGLTKEERDLVLRVCGWALDQAHDARGMGDPTYLGFLVDAVDPTEAECEQIEALLQSASEKIAA